MSQNSTMTRTETPLLFPTFADPDVPSSPAPPPRKPHRPQPPAEDILAALEALSSPPTYSVTSSHSSSTIPYVPFTTPPATRNFIPAQLLLSANPPPHPLSWVSVPAEPTLIPPAPEPAASLLPQNSLWGDLSPVSVTQPLGLWSAGVDPVSLSEKSKPIRKPKPRKPVRPNPSRFCHICARTQKSSKVYCANLKTDRKCRKAVCEPCFKELQWDFESARDGGTWLCPHCRGICDSVPRARCHIYTKTNEKRKIDRTLKR